MSSWGNMCKAMSAKLKAEAKRIKREEALNKAPEKASSNNKYTAPQATPKSCQTCYCEDRCFHKECVAPVFKNWIPKEA